MVSISDVVFVVMFGFVQGIYEFCFVFEVWMVRLSLVMMYMNRGYYGI